MFPASTVTSPSTSAETDSSAESAASASCSVCPSAAACSAFNLSAASRAASVIRSRISLSSTHSASRTVPSGNVPSSACTITVMPLSSISFLSSTAGMETTASAGSDVIDSEADVSESSEIVSAGVCSSAGSNSVSTGSSSAGVCSSSGAACSSSEGTELFSSCCSAFSDPDSPAITVLSVIPASAARTGTEGRLPRISVRQSAITPGKCTRFFL